MFSDYCKKIADEYGIKVGDAKKLIPNLGNKTNYVLDYKNLQLYLSLGIKLTKIHRALKFKQSDWMEKYIDFNTKKITNALNGFEKDLFNLMINSVYGKTMENLRKRINVRLVNTKYIFKNTLADQLISVIKSLIKIMLLFRKLYPVLMLNKSIYVGVTVLEL